MVERGRRGAGWPRRWRRLHAVTGRRRKPGDAATRPPGPRPQPDERACDRKPTTSVRGCSTTHVSTQQVQPRTSEAATRRRARSCVPRTSTAVLPARDAPRSSSSEDSSTVKWDELLDRLSRSPRVRAGSARRGRRRCTPRTPSRSGEGMLGSKPQHGFSSPARSVTGPDLGRSSSRAWRLSPGTARCGTRAHPSGAEGTAGRARRWFMRK